MASPNRLDVRSCAALVPVRELNGAKQRLAGELCLGERVELALSMMRDMLSALASVPALDRVVVVSSDREVHAEAERCGAESLHENIPLGLNGAVSWAATQLELSGIDTLLMIPGDVPLLDPAEVESLLIAACTRPSVVAVPSASGTGTNALVTSPPTVIEPAFEGHSLEAHREACRLRGIELQVVTLPGFALDVDTPTDLLALARSGSGKGSGRLATELLERRVLAARVSD